VNSKTPAMTSACLKTGDQESTSYQIGVSYPLVWGDGETRRWGNEEMREMREMRGKRKIFSITNGDKLKGRA